MVSAGYMAKRVLSKPDWLKANGVDNIYSVSNCISQDFADYLNFWKHNGYWLFDSPEIIEQLAKEHAINLTDTTMVYYEVHEEEYDEEKNHWGPYNIERSFKTNVHVPSKKVLKGFDVVCFAARTSPECSPLSCNSLADEIQTNSHCLLSDFDAAKQFLETGRFKDSEPGPYRIFAVYTV